MQGRSKEPRGGEGTVLLSIRADGDQRDALARYSGGAADCVRLVMLNRLPAGRGYEGHLGNASVSTGSGQGVTVQCGFGGSGDSSSASRLALTRTSSTLARMCRRLAADTRVLSQTPIGSLASFAISTSISAALRAVSTKSSASVLPLALASALSAAAFICSLLN